MRRIPLLATLFCLLWGATADAYVLPADYLLKLLADKRRRQKIRDLSIQLHTEETGVDEPLDERIYLKAPERFRLVTQGEETSLYVEREGISAVGTEERLERTKGPLVDLTATLLAPKGEDIDSMAARMLATLERVGIDTSLVSLGRFEGNPAFIIGARVWEAGKPQVWLDKRTYLPVRVMLRKNGTLIDTRFKGYGSSTTGNWFPQIIEEWQGKELIRKAEVLEIKINQNLPETLFELP